MGKSKPVECIVDTYRTETVEFVSISGVSVITTPLPSTITNNITLTT
jgi:hypothetical protein